MDMKMLNQMLEIAFEKRVSDLHFEVDNPPFFRARGQLIRSKLPPLTAADTRFIAETVLAQNHRTLPETLRELDASYSIATGGRFRVSIFRQRGSFGIVMRVIPPMPAPSRSCACRRCWRRSPRPPTAWCWSPVPPATASRPPWRPCSAT